MNRRRGLGPSRQEYRAKDCDLSDRAAECRDPKKYFA
jgi:hypothetical protein